MDDEGYAGRVYQLFVEAQKLPRDDRVAFLRAECPDQPELQAEVVSLLAHVDSRDDSQLAPDHSVQRPGPGHPHGQPSTIGPYAVVRLLGEGGMGVVYLVEQTHPIRRRLALKCLKWGMDSKQVLARFETERQALALMDHINIAKVIDAGATDSGRPYFVMEYAEGMPITEYCDKNRLTTEQRLRLFTDVCRGVQHAHERGVIHRDLKPTNVLVTIQDGKPIPKIIDFGLAKALGQRLTDTTIFTGSGVMIGTPPYMSPEQAGYSRQDIDGTSDVYTLGVMLYELLVGEVPFGSRDSRDQDLDGLCRSIREDQPIRLSVRLSAAAPRSTETAKLRQTTVARLRGQLRGDLDLITMKALEKERSRRYPTPGELCSDIDRHLRDEPVMVKPPSAVYVVHKLLSRHKIGLRWFIVGVILATLAGVLWIALLTTPSSLNEPSVSVGHTTKLIYGERLELDPSFSPDGNRLAFAAGPIGSTRIFVRDLRTGRDSCVSCGLDGHQRWPRWSPETDEIVFQSSAPRNTRELFGVGGRLFVVSASGGDPRPLRLPGHDDVYSATWSPDGEHIGFVDGNSIYRVPVRGGQAEFLTEATSPHSLSWSPSGEWLAYVSGDPHFVLGKEGGFGNYTGSSVWILSMDSKESSRVTRSDTLHSSPIWGPDDRTILYVSDEAGRRDIFALTLDLGDWVKHEATRLTTGLDAHTISISRDGDRLAYSQLTIDTDVWSASFPRPNEKPLLPEQLTFGAHNIEAADISSDGGWLVYSAEIAGRSHLYKMRVDDGELIQLTDASADDFLPFWSPDGNEIAFHSTRTGNRDVFVMRSDGRNLTQVSSRPSPEYVWTWAPHGNALLVQVRLRGTYLIERDQEGGEWIPQPDLDHLAHAVLPDGRYVYPSDRCVLTRRPDDRDPQTVICFDGPSDDPIVAHAFWAGKDDQICVRTVDREMRTTYWLMSADDPRERRRVKLGHPGLEPFRHSFSCRNERVYFVSGRRESDIWELELSWSGTAE